MTTVGLRVCFGEGSPPGRAALPNASSGASSAPNFPPTKSCRRLPNGASIKRHRNRTGWLSQRRRGLVPGNFAELRPLPVPDQMRVRVETTRGDGCHPLRRARRESASVTKVTNFAGQVQGAALPDTAPKPSSRTVSEASSRSANPNHHHGLETVPTQPLSKWPDRSA